MDFAKLMKISLDDVMVMKQAEEMYRKADELVEQYGFSKKEFKVAVELAKLQKKALEDVTAIAMKYNFHDKSEIILEDSRYMLKKLTLEDGTIIWEAHFYGITDPEQKWDGRLAITQKELFELYKAEYLYENFKDLIPRDYRAYYERSYGLAGIFKIFVAETTVRL